MEYEIYYDSKSRGELLIMMIEADASDYDEAECTSLKLYSEHDKQFVKLGSLPPEEQAEIEKKADEYVAMKSSEIYTEKMIGLADFNED